DEQRVFFDGVHTPTAYQKENGPARSRSSGAEEDQSGKGLHARFTVGTATDSVSDADERSLSATSTVGTVFTSRLCILPIRDPAAMESTAQMVIGHMAGARSAPPIAAAVINTANVRESRARKNFFCFRNMDGIYPISRPAQATPTPSS